MSKPETYYCEDCGMTVKRGHKHTVGVSAPGKPYDHAWGENRGWYGPKLENEGGLPDGWSTLSEGEIEALRKEGGEE